MSGDVRRMVCHTFTGRDTDSGSEITPEEIPFPDIEKQKDR